MTKLCSRCKEMKEDSCFRFNKKENRLEYWCRSCKNLHAKKYRTLTTEKSKAYGKNYRVKNSEKLKIQRKLYKETHKEEILTKAKIMSTTPKRRFAAAKSKAKRRNLQFTISFEEYLNICTMKCFYCSNQLGEVKCGSGLDRIDSTKGYESDNILPCCGVCNMIKGHNLSSEETKVAVEAILLYRAKIDKEKSF